MTRKTALFGMICLFALTLTPRVPAQEASGRVGTIDTSKLAVDLGWDREMKTNMDKLKTQLESEFKQLEQIYDSQLQAKKKAFGIKGDETGDQLSKMLTPDQQRELIGMLNNGRQNLGNVQQQANQQMQKYAADWDKQYSDAIKPIVRRIATERKISVVINTRATPVMFSDPAVDITDAVVDAAQKSPPKLTPVELPKINVSGDLGGMPATQPSVQVNTPAPTPTPTPARTNAPAAPTPPVRR